MSSILKALRKVEEEKRAASHLAPDLRADQGAGRQPKKPLAPLLTGMVLGAVCVGLFLSLTSAPDVIVPPVSSPPPVKPVEPRPEPVGAAVVKPEVETIPVVTLPPEPVAVTETAPPPTEKVVTPAKAVASESSRAEQASAAPVVITPAAAPRLQQAPPVLPEHLTLQLSEIFYQDDPANSMAVVNDLPVMVGTPVAGALVEEIHPDHIVVRVAGEVYPVYPDNH